MNKIHQNQKKNIVIISYHSFFVQRLLAFEKLGQSCSLCVVVLLGSSFVGFAQRKLRQASFVDGDRKEGGVAG